MAGELTATQKNVTARDEGEGEREKRCALLHTYIAHQLHMKYTDIRSTFNTTQYN